MCIKEKQNNSSQSLLRDPSTLNLPLAHVWLLYLLVATAVVAILLLPNVLSLIHVDFRYDECKDKLTPYLRKVGFNPAKDVKFMPCSGLTGAGLKEPVGAAAPWYT